MISTHVVYVMDDHGWIFFVDHSNMRMMLFSLANDDEQIVKYM